MAVKFLGYLDHDEARNNKGSRRLLIGALETDTLPTSQGVSYNGGKTMKPDEWSVAIIPGGGMKVYVGGSWVDLE